MKEYADGEILDNCESCLNCNNHGEFFSCDREDARKDGWVIDADDPACTRFESTDAYYN